MERQYLHNHHDISKSGMHQYILPNDYNTMSRIATVCDYTFWYISDILSTYSQYQAFGMSFIFVHKRTMYALHNGFTDCVILYHFLVAC